MHNSKCPYFNFPVYVYEVNDSPIKNNHNVILQEQLNQKADGKYSIVVSYISSSLGRFLDLFFGKIEDQFNDNLNDDEQSFVNRYILIYKHINNLNIEDYMYGEDDNSDYEFEDKYKNTKGEYYADSGFSVNVNAFNFSNLSTKVSKEGVCLGFAHITTNIYNNGNISKVLENIYNLSSTDYDVIWNKKLYSYQASSELATYADDIAQNEPILDSATMEKPDSEVVKAIEYYFENMNKKIRMKK